jgi:hypothetical protein
LRSVDIEYLMELLHRDCRAWTFGKCAGIKRRMRLRI